MSPEIHNVPMFLCLDSKSSYYDHIILTDRLCSYFLYKSTARLCRYFLYKATARLCSYFLSLGTNKAGIGRKMIKTI